MPVETEIVLLILQKYVHIRTFQPVILQAVEFFQHQFFEVVSSSPEWFILTIKTGKCYRKDRVIQIIYT